MDEGVERPFDKVDTMSSRDVIHAFLAAVERRDVEAAAAFFADDAPYCNMPHAPVFGPSGVKAMLTNILAASSDVHWDVVSEAYDGPRGHLERVDRFVIDGTEYAVACHGVFEVDETRHLITSLRDYADLTPWRAQVVPALTRWIEHELDNGRVHERGSNTIG
jgi:limonene-1,2-epoxide hydrolase